MPRRRTTSSAGSASGWRPGSSRPSTDPHPQKTVDPPPARDIGSAHTFRRKQEVRMNRIASAAVLCLGVSGAAGGSLAAAPMNVHLTGAQVEARKDVDEATKNALKAKRDEAREARKMLERQLKDENGKKRETWP